MRAVVLLAHAAGVAAVLATPPGWSQEFARLSCAPPSHDRKLAMPGKEAPMLQEKKMAPGAVAQACTTLPNEHVALVRCLSISADPTDMDVVAGWQCEGEKPCNDGVTFSTITLTRVKEGAEPVKVCVTLRNSSPKAKTLRVHFVMAPKK